MEMYFSRGADLAGGVFLLQKQNHQLKANQSSAGLTYHWSCSVLLSILHRLSKTLPGLASIHTANPLRRCAAVYSLWYSCGTPKLRSTSPLCRGALVVRLSCALSLRVTCRVHRM